MILSFGASPLPWALALLAVAAYLAALAAPAVPARWPALALAVGWLAHGTALVLDIAGIGSGVHGARFGFAPVLSITAWLVLAVHGIESRLAPLPAVRRLLAGLCAAAVLLAALYPGEPHAAGSPLAPLHWALGVACFGLFGVAVLHGWMLDTTERRLRLKAEAGAMGTHGPFGLPLLKLEKITFRFVDAGFVALTAAVLLGMGSSAQWRWDHKTVFSMLGWAVFAGLLVGRHWRGWRGRRATRRLDAGAALLALGYVGSRFVFEVLLRRPIG